MKTTFQNSRRDFLKSAALTSGGLLLGFNWFGKEAFAAQPAGADIAFNAYLSIQTDGVVTIFSPNPEIGQGIKTAFPIIVAEELDVDWANVKVVQAPLDTKKFERQVAGGSGSIPHSWQRLRKAGATARYMLVEAAAKRWQVPASECTTEKGYVYHKASGKKLSYGELATDAAQVSPPAEVKLKDIQQFNLIGTSVKGVDNKGILTGKPLFGLDFYREGMLFAMIQRPPAFGLKLKAVDSAAAKALPGVVDVVSFKDKVAVVGKSTWAVKKGKEALKIEWEKAAALESTDDHNRIFKELMDGGKYEVRRKDGDVEAAFKDAFKVVEQEYQCPFLPHNPLEPMNFFAHVREDGVELVGPTQTPQSAQTQTAKLLGIAPEKVTVQLTRMGGGFGRRLGTDYVLEAAELSSLIKAPVKVIWTREDDMTGGSYRPAVRYRFKAALDKQGNLIGYTLRGVGINAGNSTREHNFPAGAVPNLLIDSTEHKSPITTGPWRAPITNFLAFAEQSFMDDVASAAGKDPVQFRLELLEKARTTPTGPIRYNVDRMKAVIELAAEKSGWDKKRKGVHLGFSVYFSHASYVAQVAEVVVKKGKPIIQKIYAAVDCGVVINQSGARNQVMGAIVDGLGHAMYGNLTFKEGAPVQSNFNAFRLIRMNEIPAVEVHFVNNGIDPTGLGEPALPPTGGSVANAIFKATGKRLFNQPFVQQDEKLFSV
ncbi:MAG: molybdopterin cofactor-binding domain-containing protein [Spirosomataceae bacterium]